ELTTPGVRTHLAWCGIPVPLLNFAWGQATRLIFGPILLDASQFSGPQLSGHFHPSSTQQQNDVHPSLPRIGRSASAEQILWPAIRSASSARARLREAAAPCPEVHCPFHVLLRGRPSSGASSGNRRSADAKSAPLFESLLTPAPAVHVPAVHVRAAHVPTVHERAAHVR